MSKTIPLSSGYVAIVDDKDYEWLVQVKWYITGSKYLYASHNRPRGHKPRCVLMHRAILGIVDAGREVYADHINGNTLDNRRQNLRITDNKGNQGNRKFNGGSSEYRGVCWSKKSGKWVARIRCNRKLVHLGTFVNEVKAAKAYDAAAREHFGEFAKLNFPIE